MECNGFNSKNYRYFRNKIDGSIIKYSKEDLKWLLFSSNFRLRVAINIEDYQIKDVDLDKPFNLLDFIRETTLVFKHNGYLDIHFEKGEYFLITDFIGKKLASEEMLLYTILTKPETIRQYNQRKLNMVDSDEVFGVNALGDKQSINSLMVNNTLDLANEIKNVYKFNRGISFTISFKKGEIWSLTNPAISFILLNQSFINLIYNCEEVLGQEKENVFYEEYKDNVPNKNIRYYKIKDNVKINDLYDLTGLYFSTNGIDYNYNNTVAFCNGKLEFCSYNPNNFNSDGTFKYFYVEFHDDKRDIEMENEILKIADRLSKKEAIIRYKEDLEAYKYHLKEQEAIKYVSEHKGRYKKGTNRNMTPIEFMEKEQAREKKDLGKRLIKSLNKRISDLK